MRSAVKDFDFTFYSIILLLKILLIIWLIIWISCYGLILCDLQTLFPFTFLNWLIIRILTYKEKFKISFFKEQFLNCRNTVSFVLYTKQTVLKNKNKIWHNYFEIIKCSPFWWPANTIEILLYSKCIPTSVSFAYIVS